MEIKVSIIVPVYNAGVHLQKCLDTLINQTLKEIEIIIVLDCPTDGSDKIAEMYAVKDNRIVLVKNEQNMHIGHSRNKGLEVAKGKYIGFSDHDDYSELTMYEKLYEKMEKKSYDLLMCSFAIIHDNTIIPRLYSLNDNYDIEIMRESAIGLIADDITYKHSLSGVIWNKLFRHDVIKENNIQFIDTKKSSREDRAFVIEYLLCIKSVGLIQKILYYHNEGIGNTGNTFAYRKAQCAIYYLERLNKLLHDNHVFEKYKYHYYNAVQHIVFETIYFSLKRMYLLICMQSIIYFRKYSFVKEAFISHKITNLSKIKSFVTKIGKLFFIYK